MWIARRFCNKNLITNSTRLMSQLIPDDSLGNIHRKRESTNLFDPDLLFEDTLITNEGLLDAKDIFREFSCEEKLDDEGAQDLLKYNPKVDQEFFRKFLQPRNMTLEEKHYTHVGDNEVVDEDQASFFRFPRTEPYRRITAGQLYKVPNDSYKQQNVERSKSFVNELFPPYNLKDEALINIAEELKNPEANREEIIEKIKEILPKINHNLMADFVLFLTFDAKIDDVMVWKVIENCIIG